MSRANAASAGLDDSFPSSPGAPRYSGVEAIEAPAVGTVVDGVYTLRSILGRGAMGVVFLARDEILERDVAVKFVRPDLVRGASLRERFLTEARAMARVNHPNVVHVYALGQYESAPYLVMELVEGQSLERWAQGQRENGGLPDVDFALAMLEQACLGVQAIHDARTVHRDLKPGNILLDGRLRARVADLGLANLIRTGAGRRPGEIVGTPFYIAPEICLEHETPAELMARADVYSLGCMAYELLTGQVPFEARTVLATLVLHVTSAPVPPSHRRPELRDRFDEVILRALAKKPSDRTPTAEAFRRELIAARNDTREPVRILVADDDDDFRSLLVELLNHEFPFAEIEAVRNGVEAIEAFDARHHSVAVVDLNMPTLGGLELTGLLRARDAAARVPIIVLTGDGGAHEWQRLWAVGADGFLVKPVNPSDVVTLVRRALGERSRSVHPEAERAPG
ncbi:MAG: protein kinase, partial [Polyangiaceae bacterium]